MEQSDTIADIPSRRSPPQRWRHAALILLYGMMICGILILIGAALALLYLRAMPLPEASIPQTTTLVDQHGEVVLSLHRGEHRKVIRLVQMSPYIALATVAIEDHRFYDHHGLDAVGIGRATLVNIRHRSKVQGASTLTQQLARNLYLHHERTWQRKFQEMIHTLQLEMHMSKPEILEAYLNQVYYGHATYGIQAAAKLFFGKNAADLSLAESALIVGVPKGPRYYSPHLDLTQAKQRQYTVLQAMVREEYITSAQMQEALQESLNLVPLTPLNRDVAPYFTSYVRLQAEQFLGLDSEALAEGGYTIHTTLDREAQAIAEQAITETLADDPELQAALISIRPSNGAIVAMVGGRDYEQSPFNRAIDALRQPGSAFKPFVYLAALQQGIPVTHREVSEPTIFTYDQGRREYQPRNYGDHYLMREIDMREALAISDNIYAVKMLTTVGPQRIAETAKALGIASPLQLWPSLALGSSPVRPIEMAEAFAVLANGGIHQQPFAIHMIEDAQGHIVYEAQTSSAHAIDAGAAYIMTTVMESIFEPGGTGYRVASKLPKPIAGKTGTTGTDAWMVGYTPELSTAVWVGYDRDRPLPLAESRLAAPIFAAFMSGSLQDMPLREWHIPEGVQLLNIEVSSGLLYFENCSGLSRTYAFLPGTVPTEACQGTVPPEPLQPRDPSSDESPRSIWDLIRRWFSN